MTTATSKLTHSASFRTRSQRNSRMLLVLTLAMVGVFILSIFIGRYPSPGFLGIQQLQEDELAQQIVLNLRLPRILAAMLLGMALSAAGMAFQMIFANPLVEPGFLGVSQGASFGAALSILFFSSSAGMIQLSAGIFAFLGLGFSYALARRMHIGSWVLRLVLAGIAVSALFSSGLGVLKFLADPMSELPEITFWLLGGLWSITWSRLLTVLPAVITGLLVLYKMRWRLNLLSLRDEISYALGLRPTRERTIILTAAVAATAAMISISGLVSWVGLIIPHMSRRIFGANTRYSLPGAILLGGSFTMICDDIARTISAGEIPLGVITSMIGAIAFMLLMSTRKDPRLE